MTALAVVEFLVIVGLVYGAVTQVFVPLKRGTILFPWLRSAEAHLAHERARLLQQQTEKTLRDENDKLRTALNPSKEEK